MIFLWGRLQLPNIKEEPQGKTKLISQQTDKISQQPENWENHNGPDMVQAFPKKWWVEYDFTAPNLPLPLRLKGNMNVMDDFFMGKIAIAKYQGRTSDLCHFVKMYPPIVNFWNQKNNSFNITIG
jgi:hypothetical protein